MKADSLTMNHPTNPSQCLFRDVNFELTEGDSLAILGPSGSGKSTLLECLAGLRKPLSGTIEIQSVDNEKTMNPVLPHIVKVTFLSQDPFVFDGSIAANVAYPENFLTDSEAQTQKVKDALKNACLEYKNPSDSALSLSGGEKQRLAFARGFHAEPRIWMIDEGTSALDSKTEMELMKNLQKHSPDSIKILVAHRPALKNASNKHLWIGHHEKGRQE